MDSIHVEMLGGFTIRRGSAAVGDSTSHSKKVWLLLAYLICAKGRTVPLAELEKLLWQGTVRSSNPANAIKTVFFRAKSCLDPLYEGAGRQLVLRQGEGYAWNPHIPLVLDVDRFSSLCTPGSQQPQAGLEAAALFTGGFLPRLRENAWVKERADALLSQYLDTVDKALPPLEAAGRWQEVDRLCAAALKESPLDQDLACRRMAALMKLKEPAAASRLYEAMSQLLMRTLGTLPVPQAQALYRKAASRVNNQTVPPAGIIEQLREAARPGAFCCEYDVFRALYQLQARDSARSGEEACLAVLTISGKSSQSLGRRSLDLVMDNLRQMIPPLLRQGDAMAQCSVCQYVLLLPRASFENSQTVCRRICRAFSRQYPHSPAKIQAVVSPIAPD